MIKQYAWFPALFMLQAAACLYNIYATEYGYTSSAVLAISIIWALFVLFDFKRIRNADEELFDTIYPSILGITIGTFILVQVFISMLSMSIITNRNIILFIVGIFLILLGNSMPKVPYRSFMGLYITWTLKSKDIWRKTNRLGGILCIVAGVVYSAVSFVDPGTMDVLAYRILIIGIPVAMAIPLAWYSHKLYHAEKV